MMMRMRMNLLSRIVNQVSECLAPWMVVVAPVMVSNAIIAMHLEVLPRILQYRCTTGIGSDRPLMFTCAPGERRPQPTSHDRPYLGPSIFEDPSYTSYHLGFQAESDMTCGFVVERLSDSDEARDPSLVGLYTTQHLMMTLWRTD